MVLQMKGMAFLTPVYNLRVHMSTGGGDSGGLADIIQNNAPVISLCNFISISVSQVL